MSDEELIVITNEIDDMLRELVSKYNMHPLNLTGILLARLIHMNGHSNGFYQLINSISNREHEKVVDRTLQ